MKAPCDQSEVIVHSVFPSVQSSRLWVQTGRTAVPETGPGMDWQGLQVWREGGESFVVTADEGLAL